MSKPITLYSYWRSSCSWRVRFALALKGISYEYRAVNLLNEAQAKDDYAQLNPMREVPTLEIDGYVLCQSVSILEYLEETRPEIPLLPKEPHLRAKVRQIVETIAGDIQPVQNLRVMKKAVEAPEKRPEWAKYWITFGFEGLEKILKESSGKYCVGDTVTLADCCLAPQVYNANRFQVDMSKFPTIVRVNEELSKLDAFKAAHPDNQPDFVKS